MDITIDVKETYISGNGMMNSLQNGLKMLLKRIGAFTEAPVSMENRNGQGCVAQEKDLFA